jgi:hypothetical protein
MDLGILYFLVLVLRNLNRDQCLYIHHFTVMIYMVSECCGKFEAKCVAMLIFGCRLVGCVRRLGPLTVLLSNLISTIATLKQAMNFSHRTAKIRACDLCLTFYDFSLWME